MFLKNNASLKTKRRIENKFISDGAIIDSNSGLASKAHIYCDKDDEIKYSVVLTKVELSKIKNSFYKLQLLESDEKEPRE